MKPTLCPNCGQKFLRRHNKNYCLLAALIQVVRDRGEKNSAELRELLSKCDVDAWWLDVARIVDRLEAGYYTCTDQEQRT